MIRYGFTERNSAGKNNSKAKRPEERAPLSSWWMWLKQSDPGENIGEEPKVSHGRVMWYLAGHTQDFRFYKCDRKSLEGFEEGGLCFKSNKLAVPRKISCNKAWMDTEKPGGRILLPLFQQEMMVALTRVLAVCNIGSSFWIQDIF